MGVVILSHVTGLESRLLTANQTREEINNPSQQRHGRPIWSIVFPLLSLSLLSCAVKNGRRCCSYDEEIVLDDIMPYKVATEDMVHIEHASDEIELQTVSPEDRLSRKVSFDDPVDKVSVLTCSFTDNADDNEPKESSFSWMSGSGKNNYLYMND
ncbi:hypothetical protein IV203_000654 [Nitzschia inconspicua]|uniref:Uncharacterized protein n=1 Tax=Nitzschia inconspicua TaxID=303405 RepID=A0A9K3L727_9STRA|nr:hypothetical protein IV203_000654 [Nitzschia inconspicua]